MTHTQSVLAKIGRGPASCEDLQREEAEALFTEMLRREASPAQLGALLMALRWKGETPDELAGFNDALAQHTQHLSPPPRACHVVVIPTYSPHAYQPNLIPALAIRLARAGVPVLVHGGLSGTQQPPSFAVFEALGYAPVSSHAAASEALAVRNLAVVPTRVIAPELASLLDLRSELGSRHIGHMLARLLDPLPERSVRLICSSDPAMLDRIGDMLADAASNALLMRATDGEAFANPERRPRITWLQNGNAQVLYDEDSFTSFNSAPDLACETKAVARVIQDMLEGRRPTPVPLANQLAACFVATGHARDLTHARAMVAVGYGRAA